MALQACGRYCSGELSWACDAKNPTSRTNGRSFGRDLEEVERVAGVLLGYMDAIAVGTHEPVRALYARRKSKSLCRAVPTPYSPTYPPSTRRGGVRRGRC